MSTLAINGGNRTFAENFQLAPYPNTSAETARQLSELYLNSRAWSYYGEHELKFSQDFAAMQHAAHGVFMANGTVTLECALLALGIGPGDEVIVPAYTWMASASAILYTGATPVFVDCEEDSFCISPKAFEDAISGKTRAVMPVHLFGSMSDLERICTIADKHGIFVVEDAAHAHGGFWQGKGLGSFGQAGSFSFQQSKIMCSGEGGICLTSDQQLFDRMSQLKHIGNAQAAERRHDPVEKNLLCRNYRATEFQALILRGQLQNLAAETRQREQSADYLRERLQNVPGLKIQAKGRLATQQSYYIFALALQPERLKPGVDRDQVIAALQAEGVPEVFAGWAAPAYAHKLWNISADRYRVHSCEVAERLSQKQVVLFALMWLMASRPEQEQLCGAIEKVMWEYAQ
ncbi:MAG: DegT/DnrJ/EryC1/StrS family aminotransferase [Lentisphaeria bacterium]|nr:DegT/DnrJ/EryC1/StrS family aminotransferase [Lentisphaeria bacterium]